MRKLSRLIGLSLSLVLCTAAYAQNNVTIYVNGSTIIDKPRPGYSPMIIPSYDVYNGRGCYVACYSHNPINSMTRVDGNIYLHGQIKVQGNYVNGICRPSGYGYQDISKAQYFTRLCRNYVPSCHGNQCWAGGDTGGWNRW